MDSEADRFSVVELSKLVKVTLSEGKISENSVRLSVKQPKKRGCC